MYLFLLYFTLWKQIWFNKTDCWLILYQINNEKKNRQTISLTLMKTTETNFSFRAKTMLCSCFLPNDKQSAYAEVNVTYIIFDHIDCLTQLTYNIHIMFLCFQKDGFIWCFCEKMGTRVETWRPKPELLTNSDFDWIFYKENSIGLQTIDLLALKSFQTGIHLVLQASYLQTNCFLTLLFPFRGFIIHL